MAYVQLVSYSGPPAQITVSDWPAQTVFYTFPNYITNVDVFPQNIQLPSSFDLVSQISLTAQSDSGCSVILTDTCASGPATPTPTPLVDCSYILFETNGTFAGSGTVNYLDCYGVAQVATITSSGSFGFCAQSATTSSDIDIVDDETYDCTYFEGVWYPPLFPTNTMTPTIAATPTPSPSTPSFVYETITFPYSFASTNATRTVTLQIIFSALYDGTSYSIDYGGGSIVGQVGSPGYNFVIPVSGTSGNIVISAKTDTAGEVNSILSIGNSVANGFTGTLGPITATTAELKKLGAANTITLDRYFHTTGNIQELSSTTLSNLTLYNGDFTGDIQYLPDTLSTITFGDLTRRTQNTVYGIIGNLPTNISSIEVWGFNTISGNTNAITGLFTTSSASSKFILNGNNTITGLYSNLPNAGRVQVNAYDAAGNSYRTVFTGNTLSGNLTLKSNNQYVIIGGANTVTGDLSTTQTATNLVTFGFNGFNTIGGNINLLRLPTGQFRLLGDNVVSGSIDNIINYNPSIGAIEIVNRGQMTPFNDYTVLNSGNTLSGDISSISPCVSLSEIKIGGNNTITGNLTSLVPTMSTNNDGIGSLLIVSNNNTINGSNFNIPTDGNIFNKQNTVGFNLTLVSNNTGNGLDVNEINNLLSYIDNKKPIALSNGYAIRITGTGHAAPTGAGLTAKSSLSSKNFLMTTN